MTELSFASGVDPAALQTFMKRVRAMLGHDLCTPLGTIVNYASVLEADSGFDETELRDLPRRIRGQAMQTAEMLQLLLDATLLAASTLDFAVVGPDALLRSLVAELEGDSSSSGLAVEALDGAFASPAIEVEPEIVKFAWRAFLTLETTLSLRPLCAARTFVECRDDRAWLGLTLRAPGIVDAAPFDIDVFARGAGIEAPPTHRFALRLARDLVAARGGELRLLGTVGADAAIYMQFPRTV